MRGWVTSALLLSFFLSFPASPQCSYQRETSGPFRTSWLDLAIDDTKLWGATGYGAALLDRTVDPPRVIDTIALPGTTRLIVARNGVAYAAAGSVIHVLRRNASGIELTNSVEFGFPINDLELSGNTLIIATSSGIFAADAGNPSASSSTRFATGKNIFSIAVAGNTIFAADGDTSIEAFTFNGTATTPLTATVSVTALHTSNNVLYASDGQSTDIFAGNSLTRAGLIPFATTSLVSTAPNVVFTAGNDRRVRALDVSVLLDAVELFEGEVIPSGGSVNRVAALAAADGRVYVAGGDTGLTTYSVSSFIAPFAVRGYPFGMSTSVLTTENDVYGAFANGGLVDLRRSNSGILSVNRIWASSQQHVVHDFSTSGLLLTSSGATLTFWSVSSTPTPVSTATFKDPILSAVVRGATAYAVLADGSLWSADLSQASPTPARVSAVTAVLSFIERSGDDIFTGEITEQGVTRISRYVAGNFASTPSVITVDGAATAFATSGTRVAVFTFKGISVVNFAGGTTTLLTGSNASLVTDLAFTGDTLVATTGGAATVWSLASSSAVRTISLPSEAIAIDASDGGLFAAASTDGILAINPTVISQQPAVTSTLTGNRYYRKAVAGKDRLYLFDGRNIDVLDTHYAGVPSHITTLNVPGAVDIATTDRAIFILYSSGLLELRPTAGGPVRTVQIPGTDVTPNSVASVAGAAWVSVTAGCVTTGCEKRTLVYDSTLTQTATLAGGVIDVTTNGTRAFALFDSPRETRAYNVSDPAHPTVLANRASDAGVTAIAYSNGNVLTLGERLISNNETTLAKNGEELAPFTPAATSDLIIDGSCTLIAGRIPGVEIYGSPRTGATIAAVPGSLRSIAGSDGRYFVLTDYSLETISRVAAPRVPKRRAAQ